MNPSTELIETQDNVEPARLQEGFSGQLEDASLPAEQILAEQKGTRENDGGALLPASEHTSVGFVP